MSVQEFNQVGSRKVKENLEMSLKTRTEAKRKSIVEKILEKSNGKISSLGKSISFVPGMDDFENILLDIRESSNSSERKKNIKRAEDAIENSRRSYDRVLSDASLSADERTEIKKKRNIFIADIQVKLNQVVRETEMLNNKKNKSGDAYFEKPKVALGGGLLHKSKQSRMGIVNKKEEESSMGLGNGNEELKNMQTYEEYIFGEILKRKTTLSEADFDNFIKLVIDYFVNGSKIIGVLTLEEFIDERRKLLERAEQRKIEEERRELQRKLIDSDSELGASREKVELLKKQTDEYKVKLGDLRKANNSLEQTVSQQSNEISELSEKNSDLGNQVELDRRNISDQQRQIFELQRKLDGEMSAREEDSKRIQELETELDNSRNREMAAEARIDELNASTKKWRDNLSAELKKLAPADDESSTLAVDDADVELPAAEESQSSVDLEELRKSFDDLTKVMNGDSSFSDEPHKIHVH